MAASSPDARLELLDLTSVFRRSCSTAKRLGVKICPHRTSPLTSELARTVALLASIAESDLSSPLPSGVVTDAHDLFSASLQRLRGTSPSKVAPRHQLPEKLFFSLVCLAICLELLRVLNNPISIAGLEAYTQLLLKSHEASPSFPPSDRNDLLISLYYYADMGLLMAGPAAHHSEGLAATDLPSFYLETEVIAVLENLTQSERVSLAPQMGLKTTAQTGPSQDKAKYRLSCPLARGWPALEPLDPTHRMVYPNLEKQKDLSVVDFYLQFVTTRKPVVLARACSHWQGVAEWNNAAEGLIKQIGPRRFLPIEIGKSYRDKDWRMQIMSIDQFVHECFIWKKYLGYLAQFEVFEFYPHLERLFPNLDYATVLALDDPEPAYQHYLWAGPSGTMTPYHWDEAPNLLCQISGVKFVQLMPQKARDVLGQDQDQRLFNTAGVSWTDLLEDDIPTEAPFSLSNSRPETLVYNVLLCPGDVLFIPPFWWHFVRNMTDSVSLSTWSVTIGAYSPESQCTKLNKKSHL